MKYTYFIQEVESGLMKIGSSETPQIRFQNLQVSSPRDLGFVLATTLVSEKECHRRFAESKIRGEWFLPGAEMDAFLSELKEDAKKYPTHFVMTLRPVPMELEETPKRLPDVTLSSLSSSTKDYLIKLHLATKRPISQLIAEILDSKAQSATEGRPA